MKDKIITKIDGNVNIKTEITCQHRYDSDWKTNFITIGTKEKSMSRPNGIYEEVALLFNDVESFDLFVSNLSKLRKNFNKKRAR